MTNLLIVAALTATNYIGTGTVCMTEARCQQAEFYREGPRLGASVDMVIEAVRKLHKEVEALRAEVDALKQVPQSQPFNLPSYYVVTNVVTSANAWRGVNMTKNGDLLSVVEIVTNYYTMIDSRGRPTVFTNTELRVRTP